MTTIQLALIGLDLAAVAVLAFALYYRRHHRRDLLVAFLGVLAVTIVLAGSAVGTGLGLGLFGVLSIIRLRSSEIGQREVAYYFSALALGLIAGLPHTALALPVTLIGLILLVMFAADHPRLLSRSRAQLVRLDRAIMDERELHLEAEARLGLPIQALDVKEVNLVNDTTLVEVRYTRPHASTVPVSLRRAA
jgi:ABC-type antimicrobial peptide transport system permease subunit